MSIQVLKPKFHVDECLEAVRECLEKGWTGMGFKTVEFEEAWKTYTAIEKYGETGKLTEAALTEYMEKHKLTGDKLKKFNTLMEL